MSQKELSASAAGDLLLGGKIFVHRLGFGAMRLTGEDIWGPPKDRNVALAVLRRASPGSSMTRFALLFLTFFIAGTVAAQNANTNQRDATEKEIAAISMVVGAGGSTMQLIRLLRCSVFAALALPVAITSVCSALLLAAKRWGLQNRGANVGNG